MTDAVIHSTASVRSKEQEQAFGHPSQAEQRQQSAVTGAAAAAAPPRIIHHI
jgi:hypothetical protein